MNTLGHVTTVISIVGTGVVTLSAATHGYVVVAGVVFTLAVFLSVWWGFALGVGE